MLLSKTEGAVLFSGIVGTAIGIGSFELAITFFAADFLWLSGSIGFLGFFGFAYAANEFEKLNWRFAQLYSGSVFLIGFTTWSLFLVRVGYSWWALIPGFLALVGLVWIIGAVKKGKQLP